MGVVNIRARARKSPVDKSIKYYPEVILYSQIGRDAVIDAAARNSQIPRSYLEQTFDAMITECENFVMNGHSITLDNLGTIYCQLRGKGEPTMDDVQARDIQLVKFHFKSAPSLRKMVQLTNFRVFTPKGL